MESLFKKYPYTIKGSEQKLSELFSKFYENDCHINNWLTNLFQHVESKNSTECNRLRLEGNKYYLSKDFRQSFICYTKALCRANRNEIGLIFSNRSALFFMTKLYQDCLNDIQTSLKYDCSESIKLKLLIRRLKCLAKLNLKCDLDKARNEALTFLSTYSHNKDAAKQEILSISCHSLEFLINTVKEMPTLDKANSKFIYASSAIRLSYDKLRGRHVVANSELQVGDILFIEKAFSFAPVFNDNMEVSIIHCYNCLKQVYSSIPCEYCVKCIFCNETCRNKCWKECHKWECRGMQSNLWYHLGIGFPALRALVKGLPTGLQSLTGGYEADVIQFGNEVNNYPYLNRLISNLEKMDNILPIIISAGVIISYLENYTDFFTFVHKQALFKGYEQKALIHLIGAHLTKHIAQFQCNSSVINVDEHSLFNLGEASIACAIYPSISMMNHSCKPNITIEHIGDFAIVKATETVQPNEEIFNCYGIDYRHMDKKTRQDLCSQLYFFNCNCRICKFSIIENT